MAEQSNINDLLHGLEDTIAALAAEKEALQQDPASNAYRAPVDPASSTLSAPAARPVAPAGPVTPLPALQPSPGVQGPAPADGEKLERVVQHGRRMPLTEAQKATILAKRAAAERLNPPGTERFRKLDRQLRMMRMLRDELEADPALFQFVDSFVGQRVKEVEERRQVEFKAAERRQNAAAVRMTVVSSGVSLVIGWLLSAISPVSALAHMLPR